MKVNPLKLEKESDNALSVKVLFKLTLIILVLLFDITWLLPMLISSKSSFLFMLGLTVILVTAFGAYYAFKWGFKK